MWIVSILDKIRTRAVKSHLLTFVSESFSLKKKQKTSTMERSTPNMQLLSGIQLLVLR